MSASLLNLEEPITQRRSRVARTLTQDKFDLLLAWFDADRERAGKIYSEIQQRIMKLLLWRGCVEPETLADEAMDVVAEKLSRSEVAITESKKKISYCVTVAVNLHRDTLKRAFMEVPLVADISVVDYAIKDGEAERMFDCLDQCLSTLTVDNRELVLTYQQEEKQAKIDVRKALAAKLGVKPVALRVRVHRIMEGLQKCALSCFAKSDETD